MNPTLPAAKHLEKLPLRAIVAYAARTARRLSSELRGVVADVILDHAMDLLANVAMALPFEEVDKVSVMHAAAQVAAAYADAPAALRSVERFRVVFAIGHAAEAVMFAVLAASNPDKARRLMESAALEAERATRPIEVLDSAASAAVTRATRQDYEILLRRYGERDEVVIGEPIDCF
jgi:hypothetical protein